MADTIVLIEKVGDELEVTIDASTATVQRDRRTASAKSIKAVQRKRQNARHRHPDMLSPHVPVILKKLPGSADDTLEFRCNEKFYVDVARDDGFDPPLDSSGSPLTVPRSPFNVAFPQEAARPNSSSPFSVKYTLHKTSFIGNNDFMFFKYIIWHEDGLMLDPDVICEL